MKRLVCVGLATALAFIGTVHAQPKGRGHKAPAPKAPAPAPTPAPTPTPTPTPAPAPTPVPDAGSGSGGPEKANESLENGGDDRPWAKGVSRAEQTTALELFRQGNSQLNDGIMAEAVKKYREALKHWDHPAIHYNLALALLTLDQPLEVEDNLNASMKFGAAPLDKDKFEHAKEYLVLNGKQIGKIEVTCDSKGAQVSIDGKFAFTGPAKHEERVRVGRHTFSATGAGYATRFRAPYIGGGETFRIELKLYTPEELTRYRRKWDKTWIPYAVIGGGVLVGLISGGIELSAKSSYSDFDKKVAACNASSNGAGCMATSDLTSLKSSGDTKKSIGYVGYGVAAGAIGVGLVMAYMNRREAYQIRPEDMSDDDKEPIPPPIAIAPMVGPDLAGAMVFGHF